MMSKKKNKFLAYFSQPSAPAFSPPPGETIQEKLLREKREAENLLRIEKLEKEVGYWKEKALNFKKFHL